MKWRLVRDGPGLVSPDFAAVRYPLHSATPDPRLLPREELRAAYAGVLRGRRVDCFDMGDERGLPRLVRALRAFLRRTRGLTGRELLLTHGSQEAIALVAQVLLADGDAVAVGDPGYPPAWDAFRAAGARIVPLPVDEQGIDVDALGRALRRVPCRLVYLTPGRHYPTTASLSAPRRMALLEMTRRAGVAILEDDYDHEHHYRASPPPPLALEAPHVIYVSTLSKAVAPGVRIGFVAAAGEIIDRLVRLRRTGARGNDGVTQAAHRRVDRGGRPRASPASRPAGVPRATRRRLRRHRGGEGRRLQRRVRSARGRPGAVDPVGVARYVVAPAARAGARGTVRPGGRRPREQARRYARRAAVLLALASRRSAGRHRHPGARGARALPVIRSAAVTSSGRRASRAGRAPRTQARFA